MRFEVGQEVRIKQESSAKRFFPGNEPLTVTHVSQASLTTCVSRENAPAKWVKNEGLEPLKSVSRNDGKRSA